MSAAEHQSPSPDSVLAKALLNAGAQLGLKQAQIATIIGVHRSAVSRLKSHPNLDPNSKQGELALLLIRLARSLFALAGGDKAWMQHFMFSPNKLTGGTPSEQITQVQGLVRVVQTVDALRAKV